MKESFFLNKEFPQKCGDTLVVLRKSDKKNNGHTFFICKISQNISEPILINREGFLCYNCGEILK